MPRITIPVTQEVADWLQLEASRSGTTGPELIRRKLDSRMRADEYWQAWQEWKRDDADLPGIEAKNRLTRDQAHER